MESIDAQKDRLAVWHDQWNSGEMAAFQINEPNKKLMEHYDKYIQGKPRAKIFVPLCGDTYDMKELAGRGHEIVGVECSEAGLKTFFDKHNIDYVKEKCDKVKGLVFKSKDGNYRLYCCDLFDFDVSVEGQFDAILDAGSMGALRRTDLPAYADLMKTLMRPNCRHILETFVYDTEKWPNTHPISFRLEDLEKLYGDTCKVEKIDEGPNPYADMEAEYKEHEESDKACQEYPEMTATAYYLIMPK